MDKNQIYLSEIKEFCQTIINFTNGVSYDAFLADEKLQLAVIKLIENVGEGSKRLSEATRAHYSQIDWNKVMAMRNRLVHDYMDVDLAIVFDVITNEIPSLLKNLQ